MFITNHDVERHISKLGNDLIQLQKAAKDSGFAMDKVDHRGLEKAAYAMNITKTTNINDIDRFITNNIVSLQSFFVCLVKTNPRSWVVNFPFLYELAIILKKPQIFTKEYQSISGWHEDVAEYVESAIKNHSLAGIALK